MKYFEPLVGCLADRAESLFPEVINLRPLWSSFESIHPQLGFTTRKNPTRKVLYATLQVMTCFGLESEDCGKAKIVACVHCTNGRRLTWLERIEMRESSAKAYGLVRISTALQIVKVWSKKNIWSSHSKGRLTGRITVLVWSAELTISDIVDCLIA